MSNIVTNEKDGGKVWCLYNDNVEIEIVHSTAQSLTVKTRLNDKNAMITWVYAKCTTMERKELWDSIKHLGQVDTPWLVTGDFNTIRNSEEKMGGKERNIRDMMDFNDFIKDTSLGELSFEGVKIYLAKEK